MKRRFLLCVWWLCLVGLISAWAGCSNEINYPENGVINVEATQVQAFPGSLSVDVVPGQAVKLAVQALDDDEEPVEGARVNFVIVDPEALAWSSDTERTGRVTRAISREQTFEGLTVKGLAVVEVTVSEDAPVESVRILAVLDTPGLQDEEGGLAEFTLRVGEAMGQGDAGEGEGDVPDANMLDGDLEEPDAPTDSLGGDADPVPGADVTPDAEPADTSLDAQADIPVQEDASPDVPAQGEDVADAGM